MTHPMARVGEPPPSADSQRHRLVILTDMGNEPDDSQTMVHLLMYANEIDIEGLIAVTSRWLHPGREPPRDRPHPEMIVERVEAYGRVRENLLKHAPGWPTKEQLLSRIAAGQPGYGMETVGDGMASAGSRLIMEILERPDPRPVYFAINAGSNTLAQALWDLRSTKPSADLEPILGKIRVFDDAGQDNAGAWIAHTFPELFYVRSHSQVFSLYCGYHAKEARVRGPYTWEPYSRDAEGQHDWADAHIKRGHGPLGALYPDRFARKGGLEGGGTSTWIGLVNHGLFDPREITWGGWGGRFSAARRPNVSARYQPWLEEPYRPFRMFEEAGDVFTGEGVTGFDEWVDGYRSYTYNPVWKWRRGYMNDFAARMDWSVKEYDEANHNPIAAFRGDLSDAIVRLRAKPGARIPLDASASRDPDGDDLRYRWFFYPDAGPRPYGGELRIPSDKGPATELSVPKDAAGCQLHVVLQVWDRSEIMPMVDYRRIVVDVEGTWAQPNRPPLVRFLEPEPGQVMEADSEWGVGVDACDPEGQLAEVQLYLGGELLQTKQTSPYVWGPEATGRLDKLAPGAHTLRAVAIDSVGARGEARVSIRVEGQRETPLPRAGE